MMVGGIVVGNGRAGFSSVSAAADRCCVSLAGWGWLIDELAVV